MGVPYMGVGWLAMTLRQKQQHTPEDWHGWNLRIRAPLEFRKIICLGKQQGGVFCRKVFYLVVSTTHLKNMIVKMGSSSPIFGVKINYIWVATTEMSFQFLGQKNNTCVNRLAHLLFSKNDSLKCLVQYYTDISQNSCRLKSKGVICLRFITSLWLLVRIDPTEKRQWRLRQEGTGNNHFLSKCFFKGPCYFQFQLCFQYILLFYNKKRLSQAFMF